MRAELLAQLRAVARGDYEAKSPVMPATPVTLRVSTCNLVTGLQGCGVAELQELQGLQAKKGDDGKGVLSPVTAPVAGLPEQDEAAIEERAGLAADSVPAVYLDAWAQLNCQKPLCASEADWRRALDGGGRFLDQLGNKAAETGWTPGELFDRVTGLVWYLRGDRVEAIDEDTTRLSGGRIFLRRRGATSHKIKEKSTP